VGTLKAREVLYLGDFFSGREAAAWGVAWRGVAADRALEEATSLARRLTERAPRSLALEARALEAAFGTHAWREAFRERRAPRFTGE
jgi:enoyl-CoA hydratase